ncbi:MAG: PAS domain-containing protein, partial [Bacteroidota bacterium]
MKDSSIANFFASALSEKYLPAVIVVDAEFNLRHVTDPAKKYLTVPNDPSIPKLTRMIPAKLAVALQVALIKVRNEALSHSLKGIKAKIGMQLMTFDITIEPFLVPKEVHNDQLYSIILHEGNTEEWETDGYENETFNSLNEINLTLKQEVDDLTLKYKTKEHDLNEELMKLKEDLLTAEKNNETFQSIHEDLQKLNSDYRFTISELTKSKSYLEHQIESLGIPFLFLDEEINIHKFSTGVFQLVNIRQADIGRPIKHYTSVFKDFSIHNLAEDVLASGAPMEDSVLTKDEERYLVKGLPYQTTDNEHQGVVVIFYFIAQSVLEDILPRIAEALPATVVETPLPEAEMPAAIVEEVVEEVAPEAAVTEAPVEMPEPMVEPNALFAQPTPTLPEMEVVADPVLPEVEEEVSEEETPEEEVANPEEAAITEEADILPEAVEEEAIAEMEEEIQDLPVIPSIEEEVTETAVLAEEEAIVEAEEEETNIEEEEITEQIEEEQEENEDEPEELAESPVFFGEPQMTQFEDALPESQEKEEVIPESIMDETPDIEETPEKIFPTEESEVETSIDEDLPLGVVLPEATTGIVEEKGEESFVAPEFENSFLAIANADEAPVEGEENILEVPDSAELEEAAASEALDSIIAPEEEEVIPKMEELTPAVEATDIVDAPELTAGIEEAESQVLDELPEVEALPELTDEANLSVNGSHPKSPDLTQDLVQASEEFEQALPATPVEAVGEENQLSELIEEPKEELDATPQFGLLGDLPVESKVAEEPVVETAEVAPESPIVKEEPKLSFLDEMFTEKADAPVVEEESAPVAAVTSGTAPEFIELDGFDFDMEDEEEEEIMAPPIAEASPEPEAPVFPEFGEEEQTPSEEILAQEPEVAPEPVELPTPPSVEAPQPEASIEEIPEPVVAQEEPPVVMAPEMEAAPEPTPSEPVAETEELNPDAFPMYQKYFPASYDGFIVFDFQSQKVIYTDAKIPEILGFQEEELVGMHIMELSPLFQEEGILSSERMKQYFKKTLIVGQVAFEWKL